MLIYIVNIISVVLYGLICSLPKDEKNRRIMRLVFLGITFLQLWFIVAFRDKTGNDFAMYSEGFFLMKRDGFSTLEYKDWELGFVVLTKLIGAVTANKTVFFAITALLSLAGPAYLIIKHSKMPFLSVLLYMNLFMYYVSFNYVRQAIAISVICFSWDFIKKKQFIPFLAVVLFASLFHFSALIMLPAYFFAKMKGGIRTVLIYCYLLLLYYITSDSVLNILLSQVHTEYENSRFITTGISVIYIVVPFLLCAALFFARKYLTAAPPEFSYLVCLSYFAMFWMVVMTKHSLFERFSYYSYIFIVLAIPEALVMLKGFLPNFILQRTRSKMKDSASLQSDEDSGAKRINEKSIRKRASVYYALALTAVILITTAYNLFGLMSGTSGVHGVFPYSSVIPFLNG